MVSVSDVVSESLEEDELGSESEGSLSGETGLLLEGLGLC